VTESGPHLHGIDRPGEEVRREPPGDIIQAQTLLDDITQALDLDAGLRVILPMALDTGAGAAVVSPQRIQLRRTAGWKKPAGAVTVSRGTFYGNPFRIGHLVRLRGDEDVSVVINRELAVALFRAYAVERTGFSRMVRRELAGKTLACWCAPDVPCHADVLLEIANGAITP
jgi:aspartate aminotransferase-like enzyme